MADEELQLRAQRSLQEYEDAVENLDPNFAELGRKCVAVLDEFIEFWNHQFTSRALLAETYHPTSEQPDNDMRKFVERQLEWAQSEKKRVLAQLSKK
ncbi:MAG: hypothetical protein AUG51_20415 [Acidobacteria bacterium 13_1_20CM_3_53_8]|nr:MAG: hypothetical protein AUG51_20415 [Acidobacteria bacterium 13_1_20CM_3_53_8]